MKLFISTGGKGTRLSFLTKDIPKPMVQIAGKPVLHHLVEWAKKYNIEEIIMLNGYKSEVIVDYFKDGTSFNIPIKHSNEPYVLDSGGAIKFAQKYISGPFAYISGDHLCDVNLHNMIAFHNKKESQMTIFVHNSTHPQDADIIKVNENNQVIKFISKHADHTDAGKLSNAGLCIIEPEIMGLMNKEVFNFENYIYPKAINQNFKIMAYTTDEFIADMGTPERLKKCEEHLKLQ